MVYYHTSSCLATIVTGNVKNEYLSSQMILVHTYTLDFVEIFYYEITDNGGCSLAENFL
jgi:hypothetical protein